MSNFPFAFCTIITADHMHCALALRDSLVQYNGEIKLFVFVVDANNKGASEAEYELDNIQLVYNKDVCLGLGKQLFDKYYNNNLDCYRWSMKPVLMQYLLQLRGLQKVIYVDCDIHFYNDYHFLFELLDQHHILLTPHNRSLNPFVDESNFVKNFKEGIYNGGFIGASINGIKALEWWATACYYNCKKDFRTGLYDDQKYLDLLPARFDNVYSIKHLGCNVSEWNLTESKRFEVDGEVLINSLYPVIFIHFVSFTIKDIIRGKDALLMPHLRLYNKRLKNHKAQFDLIESFERELNEVKASKEPRHKFRQIKSFIKRIKA